MGRKGRAGGTHTHTQHTHKRSLVNQQRTATTKASNAAARRPSLASSRAFQREAQDGQRRRLASAAEGCSSRGRGRDEEEKKEKRRRKTRESVPSAFRFPSPLSRPCSICSSPLLRLTSIIFSPSDNRPHNGKRERERESEKGEKRRKRGGAGFSAASPSLLRCRGLPLARPWRRVCLSRLTHELGRAGRPPEIEIRRGGRERRTGEKHRADNNAATAEEGPRAQERHNES